MPKVKIEFLDAGFRELFFSDEVTELVDSAARDIQSRCGDGYETDIYRTPSRMIASVFTATRKAYFDNLKNNTLLRALPHD